MNSNGKPLANLLNALETAIKEEGSEESDPTSIIEEINNEEEPNADIDLQSILSKSFPNKNLRQARNKGAAGASS